MEKIYSVYTTNLDRFEGETLLTHYTTFERAFSVCEEYVQSHDGEKVVIDKDATSTEYYGRNLEYTSVYGCAAVYYISYYGRYKCAAYVKEVPVYS